MPEKLTGFPTGIELRDEDIYEAMKGIPGYLDITPGDFKEVYRLAFQHALERLSREVTAAEIMTQDVVTVNPDTPVADVPTVMGQRRVSGVPVVGAGALIMLAVALLVNNLAPQRRYPEFWW